MCRPPLFEIQDFVYHFVHPLSVKVSVDTMLVERCIFRVTNKGAQSAGNAFDALKREVGGGGK